MKSFGYGKQSITLSEIAAASRAMISPHLTMGPRVQEFEIALSEFLRMKHVTSFSNGTAALHGAYQAIAERKVGTVITSPFTFIATASTAILSGLSIEFCDVEVDGFNINTELAASMIRSDTSAVAVVDFAGLPVDIRAIKEKALEHGAYVVRDAAHSLGSFWNVESENQTADLTTYSFFPTKNLTTFEGGAVAGDDATLINSVKLFKGHGIVRESESFLHNSEGGWYHEAHRIGLNYRLSEVQAAVGLVQLRRQESMRAKRQLLFDRYVEHLEGIDEVTLPIGFDKGVANWHLFPIRVPSSLRRRLFDHLHSVGIKVQVNYIPVYFHPAFSELGYKRGLCPNAERAYSEEISLPMFADLSWRQQSFVIRHIRNFFHLNPS